MWSSFGLLSLLCVVTVAVQAGNSHHKHHHRLPIIQLNGAEELIGTLREDEHVVSLSPRLSIYSDTGPVCKYELTSTSNEEVPFEVEILDKHAGTAVIRVKKGSPAIDCSHSEYHLEVVAVRCADDLARSTPAVLKITVKDVNNHAPEFDSPWYSFDVEEGKIVSDIARLYTSDKDCGHPYGKICRYEITNALEGFPFHIDDQGVLSNLRPLNRSEAESHILTVVAYDCGMQRSKSTLVTINVHKNCVDGLRNVPKNDASAIQYQPGTGAKTLLPDAELLLCPSEKKCDVKSASVDLELETIQEESTDGGALTKKCGSNLKTLELLPQPKEIKERDVIIGKDGKEKELLLESAENLSKAEKELLAKADAAEEDDDDGIEDEDDNDEDLNTIGKKNESPNDRNLFDGKTNSILIPKTTVDKIIPERFTLSFSMKHAAGSKEDQKLKENILCESDDFNMNRHHFAVYIRHCKLELLLRREAAHSSSEFRAAEWRWEAPEICDSQWHSYAILFSDLDNVALFIDGRKFASNERNPEILDDWPLHETKEVKTKLVVGACWHGRAKQMVQHFKGRLQNMYLLLNEVEQEAAIECLHQPAERLSFNEQLDKGEHANFTKQQTRLTLTANNMEDLSTLLQKVQYVNTAASSHPGKRRLTVSPSVTCGTEKQTLASYETTIQVKKPQDPVLSISGQNMINIDRHSLKLGTAMLPDLQITITQTNKDKSEDVTEKYSLDWCKLHLKPPRDMNVEYFSSPAALIASMNVDFEHDEEGILLKGNERANGYREVLSKIHYFNTRPDALNKRLYSVQCSMEKGKVLSNEFFVTMSIDSELDETIEKLERASKKLEDEEADKSDFIKHFEPSAFDQLGANRLQNILEMDLPRPKALLSQRRGYEMGQGAVAGGAVAIVVVICVGFLLVLLVVGVLKMRDTPSVPRRRRSRKNPTMQQEEGMEWDDSGLNITVNPLDDVEKQEQAAYSEEEEDEESSDGESYHDDDFSDEEEGETMPALPHSPTGQGLDWDDDSGLQSSTNVSRTYRV